MTIKTLLCAMSLTATTIVPVAAAPVDWVLQDITFADGATATGGFTFDAETNLYSNINISRTEGLAPGGANNILHEAAVFTQFTPGGLAQGPDIAIFTTSAADQTDQLFFQLFFAAPLTDAANATALNFFGTGTGRCASLTCDFVQAEQAVLVTSGSVAPAAVPLPASIAFLLFGLAGFAGLRRLQD